MRFVRKQARWGRPYFVGRKKGLEFKYSENNGWYAVVKYPLKDIVYNSLWEGIKFITEEEVKQFCETFNPEKHGMHIND